MEYDVSCGLAINDLHYVAELPSISSLLSVFIIKGSAVCFYK